MDEGVGGEIERLIRDRGRITFAQFMDMALFSPVGGYYTSRAQWEKKDFYTAPVAHPAFGALLALQLEQLWEIMGFPSPFYVLEMGASGGILARDIVAYSSCLPSEFHKALEYVTVDYQAAPDSPQDVHPIKAFGFPFKDVVGCIVSNELLDAFPVHRFAIQSGSVKEVYVTVEEDYLVEVLDEPSTPLLEKRLSSLGLDLPEGFRGEANLAMDGWIWELSNVLNRGFVLTFDYGHLAHDLYSPERSGGTLRCYYRHVMGGNPYRHIGRQDITAHVDFTSLMRSGEDHGLTTVGYITQREFLQNMGFSRFLDSLGQRRLSQSERDTNRMGMLELVKAGEMGDFKVLAQAKGLHRDANLKGFAIPGKDFESGSLSRKDSQADRDFPLAPLLSTEHLDLMAGRYPHLSWEWEGLWPSGNDE
ncbi:class I SAM-dependent methyltransferase [SAR202 cluster bacterium AC-647-N09_OGT_505m]|nr:class I SAM-dependent methyltransferase [SAR202 cluster bacterium AC-647-N09_OGT_505m]